MAPPLAASIGLGTRLGYDNIMSIIIIADFIEDKVTCRKPGSEVINMMQVIVRSL